MVGRRAADVRGFPLHVGGRALERGSVEGRLCAGAARRRQAARVRGRRQADRPLFLGRAQPGFPAKPGRSRSRSASCCRPLHEAVPQEVSGRGEARADGRGSRRQELGSACTRAWRGSTARKTRTCRRSIRGATRRSRRPSSSSSSATRSSTASTRTACSFPISTRCCSTSARRRSSRPRPARARATCSSSASTSPTTHS